MGKDTHLRMLIHHPGGLWAASRQVLPKPMASGVLSQPPRRYALPPAAAMIPRNDTMAVENQNLK